MGKRELAEGFLLGLNGRVSLANCLDDIADARTQIQIRVMRKKKVQRIPTKIAMGVMFFVCVAMECIHRLRMT